MTLDKNSIRLLLTLDDAHLASVIKQLAASTGVPTDSINLSHDELQGIRQALSMATDSDIARATELIREYQNGKRG